MIYQTIKDKVIESLDYKDMSYQEIADYLNNLDHFKYRTLSSKELLLLSASLGCLKRLEDAAKNGQLPEQIQSAALAAMKVINRDNTELDLSLDLVRINLLGGLTQAGVLKVEEMQAIIASGTVYDKWSNLICGQKLSADDIRNSLAEEK